MFWRVRRRGRPPTLTGKTQQNTTWVNTGVDRGSHLHRIWPRGLYRVVQWLRHRTMRTLALHAYHATGAPVFTSSVPGPVLPVEGEELGWTYDAVCEAARAGAGV
jgi:hypothetical protein